MDSAHTSNADAPSVADQTSTASSADVVAGLSERIRSVVDDPERSLNSIRVERSAIEGVFATLDSRVCSESEIAAAIGSDPIFTCRLLRLTNSRFFDGDQRLVSLDQAVHRAGPTAIRSLTGRVFRDSQTTATDSPDGFTEHARRAAAGCELMAQRVDVPVGLAHVAGLVHDLGRAILAQAAPDDHRRLAEAFGDDTRELRDHEVATFGIAHDQLAGLATRRWGFPEDFCAAIERHHFVPPEATPLDQVVLGGHALAQLSAGNSADEAQLETALQFAGVSAGEVASLVAQID
jgi:HD-like signal output (HDOD) protein